MSENGPGNCVIDAEGTAADKHRGFRFWSGEGQDSILEGFTIRGGYHDNAGGIYCKYGSSPTIVNNIITANRARDKGGGIRCKTGSATIINNAIISNTAGDGGGIRCWLNSSPTVSNCILWGNTASNGEQIAINTHAEGPSSLAVRYSDVQGGQAVAYVEEGCALIWGAGNIDADPLFADPDNGDYHLKSKYGLWEAAANGGAGGWVSDEVTSPCTDAGVPGWDASNEPQPNAGTINIGAYGNTPEASKSEWITGDVTGDCVVNVLDMINVRNHLYEPVGSGDNWRYDLTGDGMINVLDMLVVRNNARNRCE